MANNIIRRAWNQNRMVNIEDLTGAAFEAESGGHTFQVAGIDDTGAVVDLSGTVAAVFRRPDNADIALTGSASGGVVSVTLTDDCYAVAGRFGLTIFVTSNSQKVAVYACVGTVAQTNGGAVAGSTPQDVVDLINAINAAVQSIPADYSDLMAAVAPTYSNTALYAKGAYAWYDGVLYKAVVDISTAESFTAAHWEAVSISDDLFDILNYLDAGIKTTTKLTPSDTKQAYIGTSGNPTPSTTTTDGLDIYPVTAGNLYLLHGVSVRLAALRPIASFNTALFDGANALTGSTIIIPKDNAQTLTDYNVAYKATADGYIYIAKKGSYNTLGLYDAEYKSNVIELLKADHNRMYDFDPSVLFEQYESAYIDDFTHRSSMIDTAHPYTLLGTETDAPTITTGTGATRTGASGMTVIGYSRQIDEFPYVCCVGLVSGASTCIKLFDTTANITDSTIIIAGNRTIQFAQQSYGSIHVNATYIILYITPDGVTLFDDTGINVFVPVTLADASKMNIALMFGNTGDRAYGFGSFVEFVKRPMQTLNFNKCIIKNRAADSATAIKSVIRFSHGVWDNGSSITFYFTPDSNPYMEDTSSNFGLSNNPCIKCVADYAEDYGYRTEIGVTPIKTSLDGKLGALQRIHASADYYMPSAQNQGTDDFYTYIFQIHDSGFTLQGWTDGPPLALRVKSGRLSAHVCYIDDGAVPQSDNRHTVDAYDLCAWAMDTWHHVEVEARIGWRDVLAPRLIVWVDGKEVLNREMPIGYNIVTSGGYVNTHWGVYTPEWHDLTFEHTHAEIYVTNIHWEGTQNVN